MRDQLRELTSRSPQALGWEKSRWTLELLRKQCGDKAPETDAGTWQMLDRLGVTHTRGEGYTLSPDEYFEAKRAFIEGVRMRVDPEEAKPEEAKPEEAEAEANESAKTDESSKTDESRGDESRGDESRGDGSADRLFYLDELTYELHPTIASEWSSSGTQPRRRRGACGQEEGRLLGAIDAESGRVFYRQKQSVGRTDLVDLYREMASFYKADRLWVVQDNAPFHFHPDVLRELESQVWPRSHPAFEYARPPNWTDPTEAAQASGDLSVQIVPLPTYASWLNPIERLWRWLKQDVLHLHPYAGNWKKLKRGVRSFLNRFVEGSEALLSYTGLSGD